MKKQNNTTVQIFADLATFNAIGADYKWLDWNSTGKQSYATKSGATRAVTALVGNIDTTGERALVQMCQHEGRWIASYAYTHNAAGEELNADKVNKRVIAEAIFVQQFKKARRRDIIAQFVEFAKLTVGGAPTYYNNFKKKYDAINAAVAA